MRRLHAAGALPGKALHVELHIQWMVGMRGCPTVAVNLSAVSRAGGFHRTAATRGLKALEDAGLVKVERRSGRKTLVTVIELPPPTSATLVEVVLDDLTEAP